jgi:hypothetical protein
MTYGNHYAGKLRLTHWGKNYFTPNGANQAGNRTHRGVKQLEEYYYSGALR